MAHQLVTMEVAPSKLPSMMARRASRLPMNLDTIAEDDDKEAAMESQSSPMRRAPPLRNAASRGLDVIVDTPMLHCADKLAFLAPMAKTAECLKIKA